MREISRFIPGEEIDAVAPWSFGAVASNVTRAMDRRAAADQASAQAMRQEGYVEGFAQGQAHAVLGAEQKISAFISNQGQEAARHWAGLVESTHSQLLEAQQVMAQGVLELACELAKQVLRHELSVNPNALQPVIREGLALLADDTKSAVVRLNPLDIEVLQGVLQAEFPALALTLIADASVTQGSCLIASAGTVVDGDLAARWRRAVAKLGLDVAWED